MSLPYTFIIGLEVHVELNTQTKMFCRCLNQPFGSAPNSNICPVCTGLPGTLPVPNREAVRKTILVGKALGSEIPRFSKWDRKHYFYPDTPRGYQISQYDLPLCVGGQLDLLDSTGAVESTVRFERVHLEDDAGKLLHGSEKGTSQVDLNRAGVPLIEMVTKPDLTSPEQARRFMQELRLLARTLGVSDADMEKGQMRCDVNVNIKFEHEGQTVVTPITEVKNVNSTRAVERSLYVEAGRQYEEWLANGPIRAQKHKLTAGWDEDRETVTINRAKEAANDYRYFPEPDLPPLEVYEQPDLTPEGMTLPELPNQSRTRLFGAGLQAADIEILISDPLKQAALERYQDLPLKSVANWLVNTPESATLSVEHFRELLSLVESGKLRVSAVKQQFAGICEQLADGISLEAVAEKMGLIQVSDPGALDAAVAAVLAEQTKAVEQYKAGDQKIFAFLVGQVLKATQGKAVPQEVQAALKKALE